MSTENPKREHSSTYFVQDRSNQQERERVQLQDEMLTMMMGGVLPEQADPTIFHDVLDVGCGCGSWLIASTKTYPTMSRLVGIDVSRKMIEYARAEAQAQGIADRVEFHMMDALSLLEFPDDSFDLVNQRLGASYLRTWDWPNILQKYQRVIRPDGVVRITECGPFQNNSPALTQLDALLVRTFFKAGHFKTEQMDAIIKMLPPLFEQQGFQHVQTQAYSFRYVAGTHEGELFAQDMTHAYSTLLPFMRKWTSIPDNYEEIYQQALTEMRQPGFVANWDLQTIWGNPPALKASVYDRFQ